jgi:hypothetical protein
VPAPTATLPGNFLNSGRSFLGSLVAVCGRPLLDSVFEGLLSALLGRALCCLLHCWGACRLFQRASGALLLGANSALVVALFTLALLG